MKEFIAEYIGGPFHEEIYEGNTLPTTLQVPVKKPTPSGIPKTNYVNYRLEHGPGASWRYVFQKQRRSAV